MGLEDGERADAGAEVNAEAGEEKLRNGLVAKEEKDETAPKGAKVG